jgi:hypothetical protein
MQQAKIRRFTLIDAMVLIAATALALVPIRYGDSFGLLESIPSTSALEWLSFFAYGSYWILTPLLVAWSLALWALRFRQPRPRLRRLFRQPGMTATTAILLTVLLLV